MAGRNKGRRLGLSDARLFAVGGLLLVAWLGAGARLFYVQVIESDRWAAESLGAAADPEGAGRPSRHDLRRPGPRDGGDHRRDHHLRQPQAGGEPGGCRPAARGGARPPDLGHPGPAAPGLDLRLPGPPTRVRSGGGGASAGPRRDLHAPRAKAGLPGRRPRQPHPRMGRHRQRGQGGAGVPVRQGPQGEARARPSWRPTRPAGSFPRAATRWSRPTRATTW